MSTATAAKTITASNLTNGERILIDGVTCNVESADNIGDNRVIINISVGSDLDTILVPADTEYELAAPSSVTLPL